LTPASSAKASSAPRAMPSETAAKPIEIAPVDGLAVGQVGDIVRRDRLGGLIHEHERKAA
jgi:hypothetical protein